MLERHFSEAHADAEKNISVQDEGKKLFDKGVIIKNGQKRRDKNVIKTLKCFKLVPNAKNKMINGHKFHSGKSSVVKTYLKRGRKKLKSAPEIDLFDWFSNEIEKDDKEANAIHDAIHDTMNKKIKQVLQRPNLVDYANK